MNATMQQPRLREIVCSNCGDGLGEFSVTSPFCKLGPCCEGLPEPWDLDAGTSTWTAPAGSDEDREDYAEDEEPCQCFDCRESRGELDPDEIEALDEDQRNQYREDWG